MKRNILLAALFATSLCVSAQDISLPAPDMGRQTLPTMQALAQRKSVRQFQDKQLSQQDVADLLWAACGVSRDNDHRTAPSAMNRKEIRLFVFMPAAVYEYDAVKNALIHKADGDHRSIVAGRQESVAKAPVCIVLVGDMEKFGRDDTHARMTVAIDAGIVSENISLYCAAAGLATVPRGSMEAGKIRELLHLGEQQTPLLNNPVGFPAE